jgi:hypothetical protein
MMSSDLNIGNGNGFDAEVISSMDHSKGGQGRAPPSSHRTDAFAMFQLSRFLQENAVDIDSFAFAHASPQTIDAVRLEEMYKLLLLERRIAIDAFVEEMPPRFGNDMTRLGLSMSNTNRITRGCGGFGTGTEPIGKEVLGLGVDDEGRQRLSGGKHLQSSSESPTSETKSRSDDSVLMEMAEKFHLSWLSRRMNDQSSTKAAQATRKRKKDNEVDGPRRPLTAYNIFFSVMRKTILEESDEGGSQTENEKQRIDCGVGANEDDAKVANDLEAFTQDLMNKRLCRKPTKRMHGKSHGKASFSALAKMVGQRWQELPQHQKNKYKHLAAIDSDRYQREKNIFKKTKKTNPKKTS